MMRHIRVAFILSLTVVLTATEVLGLTLSDLMNRREANVQALVNATERLFAGRCTDANCVSSTSSNASGCSFSSCGGNALFQRAMQCYRNFGTDASLCGTGCSGLLRSASNSAVTVAAGATNNAEASTFVCSSSSLTPVFEDLYENQNVAGWQYVASNTGVTRSYPAAYQSSSTSCAAPPDTRQANWYVSASTGPKDIVFVCDFSGSMAATDGGPNGMTRLAAMKIGVTSLLASLGPDDRFNIVCFSSTVTVLGPGGALLAGTPANILSMQNALNAFAIGGGTIYAGAFSAALSLMQSNTSTGCARIVMFLTDGAPSDTAATINASIATGQAGLGVNRARIFTYSLSYAFTPTLLRSVACSNGGMWNQIEDASSPNSPLQQYYRFQAVGIVDGKPQWTAPNTSLHGQGSIVTVSMAYFDRSVTPKVFAGVAAIEVLESELLSVGTLAQITAQTTARNSQCLSYDLTECQMQKLRNEANFVCPSPAPALTACTSTNVTVPVCTSGGTDVTNISQVMCNSSAMPNMTEMTCCPLNRCPTSLSRESASTSVTSSDLSTPTNTQSPTASLSPPTFTTTAVPTTSNTTSMTQSPSIASASPGSTETKLSSATRHSLTVSESAPTMSIPELSLSMTSSHTLHSTDSISFRHLSVSATVSPSPPTSSRTPTTSLVTASTRSSDTASLSVPPTKSPRSSHSGTVPVTQTIADVLLSASRSMLHSQSASLSHSPSTSSTPSSALSMTLAGPDSLSNTIPRESLSSALPNSDSHSVQLSTSLIRTATRVSLTLEHTASAGASG
ncbi:transmembrane protein, putative [Bodo saltans]|uniref:Transmembrane protein, putative n=1 Tax=Bodo saltans TaxID=75058 RepID=A0A0S4J9G9_BODSA|nr:transmembrane protein, putative [Bodo saltans]|eukprot:CUG88016.1 transmembrane protein, putative [Bodo saltans]